MKKIITTLGLAVLLVGCGGSGDSITCTGEQNGGEAEITVEGKSGGKVEKVTMKVDFEYDEITTKETVDAQKDIMTAAVGAVDGMKMDVETNDDTYTLIYEIDYTKVDEEELENLGISLDDLTAADDYDKAVEELKDTDGLDCK